MGLGEDHIRDLIVTEGVGNDLLCPLDLVLLSDLAELF